MTQTGMNWQGLEQWAERQLLGDTAGSAELRRVAEALLWLLGTVQVWAWPGDELADQLEQLSVDVGALTAEDILELEDIFRHDDEVDWYRFLAVAATARRYAENRGLREPQRAARRDWPGPGETADSPTRAP